MFFPAIIPLVIKYKYLYKWAQFRYYQDTVKPLHSTAFLGRVGIVE